MIPRVRVLLDVDEVLADFCTVALPLIERLSGAKLDHEAFHTWNAFEALAVQNPHLSKTKIDKVRNECFNYWDFHLHSEMRPFPEAYEGVEALRGLGAELVVVSSSAGWARERNRWLKQHFGFERDEIVYTSAKHVVVGDVFVDDRPEHVLRWADDHPTKTAILFDRPHNRYVKNFDALPNVVRGGWSAILTNVVEAGRS